MVAFFASRVCADSALLLAVVVESARNSHGSLFVHLMVLALHLTLLAAGSAASAVPSDGARLLVAPHRATGLPEGTRLTLSLHDSATHVAALELPAGSEQRVTELLLDGSDHTLVAVLSTDVDPRDVGSGTPFAAIKQARRAAAPPPPSPPSSLPPPHALTAALRASPRGSRSPRRPSARRSTRGSPRATPRGSGSTRGR